MVGYSDLGHQFDKLIRSIEEDSRYQRVAALHASIDGDVVCDRTWSPVKAHDLFSVTKTITGLLTGVALQQGLLSSIEEPLVDVVAFDPPPELTGQRVRHLLTMTRGAVVDGEWDLDEIAALDEPWAPKIAAAPARAQPGSEFCYDNAGVHLLAALLHQLTGDLAQFADEHLLIPLEIEDWAWARDPAGVPIGAAHLTMTARDLATVGELLLNQGAAPDGRTVVSPNWVETMRTPTSAGGPPERRPYGHLLWLDEDGTFFGAGWAGNLLLVRPRDRLVIVALADPGFTYGPPVSDQMPSDWQAPLPLIREFILQPMPSWRLVRHRHLA